MNEYYYYFFLFNRIFMLQNYDILELQEELDTAFESRYKLLMRVNSSDSYNARRTSDGLTVAIRVPRQLIIRDYH
jgi:hypothetical protein